MTINSLSFKKHMETNPRKSFAFCIVVTFFVISVFTASISFSLTAFFVLTKKGIIVAKNITVGNFIEKIYHVLPYHNEYYFSAKIFIVSIIVLIITFFILIQENKDSVDEK